MIVDSPLCDQDYWMNKNYLCSPKVLYSVAVRILMIETVARETRCILPDYLDMEIFGHPVEWKRESDHVDVRIRLGANSDQEYAESVRDEIREIPFANPVFSVHEADADEYRCYLRLDLSELEDIEEWLGSISGGVK